MNNNSDLLVVRLYQPGVDLALRARLVLFLIVAAGHGSHWWGCPLWSRLLARLAVAAVASGSEERLFRFASSASAALRAHTPRATKMAGAQHAKNALAYYRREASGHRLGCPESGRRMHDTAAARARNPHGNPHIPFFVWWLHTCVAGPGLPVAANHDAFPAL